MWDYLQKHPGLLLIRSPLLLNQFWVAKVRVGAVAVAIRVMLVESSGSADYIPSQHMYTNSYSELPLIEIDGREYSFCGKLVVHQSRVCPGWVELEFQMVQLQMIFLLVSN